MDRVLPCGIPCVIVCVFDCACCVCVDCWRFWKYDAKKAVVVGEKLNSCCSLCSSFLCDIVSYALDRSTYIASVGLCLCLCLCMMLVIVWSASVVLESGLNAYCVGDMRLCFMRWFMSWVLIIVSSSFAMMGSSEMGR